MAKFFVQVRSDTGGKSQIGRHYISATYSMGDKGKSLKVLETKLEELNGKLIFTVDRGDGDVEVIEV